MASPKPSLARWLKASGRTQRDIAAELGITPAHVCNVLQRKRVPSARLAQRIIALTGLALADLLPMTRAPRPARLVAEREPKIDTL
jgi:transcriptional regulator with XRE-family HTH domain